jgi:hypothetical protein
LALGTRDGYEYVFGKGKSETTITGPDTATAKGTPIIIKGTVLDQSPAQPGTPCVSKESMALQMEHLHLQTPIGGVFNNETINGVPVQLTAIDPNGNVVDIGTTTTNGYYGTFSYVWTPEIEGKYEVMASFAGDDSYGSSSAATAVAVSNAPQATTPLPTQAIQAAPDYTLTLIGIGIAIIIAVAATNLLMLRRRS